MDIQHTNHPILILVRGIPGSGKTYLASALQKLFRQENVAVLDPDSIDYTGTDYLEHSKNLTAEGVDEKLHPYRFVRAKAHQAITEHKIIIWTQGFTSFDGLNKTIINLQNYAVDHGTHLPLLIVEVEINETTARERAAKREAETGRSVSEEAFARFVSDYKSFADQGYNTVTIHGEDDIAQSVATVEEALKKLEQK